MILMVIRMGNYDVTDGSKLMIPVVMLVMVLECVCVVAVVFQIAFHAEIHANDFFYFLKIIFDISTSKRSKKYKPHSILAKKKFQNLMKHSYKHNAKQSLSD
jgi:hypothetical protein